MHSFLFFLFIFGIFAFIMTGQIRQETKRGGVGSGKVLESGLELGTPVAQRLYENE